MADDFMLMTVEELVQATGGSCPGNYAPDSGCSSVVTDSRSVQKGSLFIPLIGENQDGHRYIPEALDSGARIVFVDAAHAVASNWGR